MYNNIMNLMNSLEARYYADINDNIIENTENEYNIILAIDPITIAMSGLAIAAGGLLHFEHEQIAAILVDEHYLSMSETGKRFTIAHELGHLVCQLEKFRNLGYIRNIDDEFEADEYALEQLGLETTLEGLNEIKNILKENFVPDECLEEINIRIENILNKSMVTC